LNNIGNTVQDRSAVLLIFLSFISLIISYATSILVARSLGPIGFESYAVAIATLTLLSTLSESGVGKLAIQMLPVYQTSKQWQLTAGYWRFSIRLVLLVSCILAFLVLLADISQQHSHEDHAILVAALFLPAAALSGVGIDFLMAIRAPIHGATISRLVIPTATLILMMLGARFIKSFDAPWAVACFGFGSLLGVILTIRTYRKQCPNEVLTASPSYCFPYWSRECLTFFALATLVSWIFRSSVIALGLLPLTPEDVSSFAAAAETGSMILLLSKSTDKYFQPHLAVFIERHAWSEGDAMRQRRLIWVGAICIMFFLLMVFAGKSILSLYGDSFVRGYPALCLISAGCCLWSTFSLAPAYLKFSGSNRTVLLVTAASALAMITLTFLLGSRWGTTGAAVAFCVVLTSTSLIFLWLARRHFLVASRQSEDLSTRQ
jgi:O-antigen/teichoic acid export membrane protein